MNSLLKDIRIIDTDTHVSEAPDLWTSRVSTKKWGDLVPHVRWDDEGKVDRWWWAGVPGQAAAAAAVAGWHEDYPGFPPRLEDVDPGAWKAIDRLSRMDDYGIYAEILYPNIGGFGSARFISLGEPELMLACVRAYNDYLAEEWLAVDPDRFVPIMALPFWDIGECLTEAERCVGLGLKGILFSGDPDRFGQPTLADPYWDPLWSLAEDAGLPINFHIGNSDDLGAAMQTKDGFTSMRTLSSKLGVSMFLANSRHIVEVIASGICHRFPRLNFVSVESGVGWVPFVLEALEWNWKNNATWKDHREFELSPTEYFLRQIYACFWFEAASVRAAIEILGDNNFLYETDYPHPVSMSPGPNTSAVYPTQYIAENLSGLPDESLHKVLHDNAARIYHVA